MKISQKTNIKKKLFGYYYGMSVSTFDHPRTYFYLVVGRKILPRVYFLLSGRKKAKAFSHGYPIQSMILIFYYYVLEVVHKT